MQMRGNKIIMKKKQWDTKQLLILKTLDEDKKTSKAYQIFKSAIKSDSTLRAYNFALDKFMILSKFKSYNDAAKLKTDIVQDYLESYMIAINHLKYYTANQYLSGVELFFDMNKVLYHKRILRKLLPSNDVQLGGKDPYTTEEIERMLSVTIKLRSKAVLHFFASTGCRPAGVIDPVLRMKHIEDMPHNCKSVFVYDGSKQGYYAFLTPEASKSLNDYFRQRKLNGEILTEESVVFANSPKFPTTKQAHLSQSSIRQIMRDANSKAGIERIKTGKRYDKAEVYAFRKRFNTILKLNNDVNSNIAEKLMAHKRGLDGTYLQPTKEECFIEFIKAIPQLTIDKTERQKITIATLENEKENQESIRNQMDKMKQELEELKYGPIGRRNKYNQNFVNAPVPSEMKILTMAIPILLELLFPEEKKRDMMKEFEKAELEDRKPDLHKIFGSRQMDEDHIRFLKKFLREHRHKKDSSKSTNYVKPRLRIENLEAMLQNHN